VPGRTDNPAGSSAWPAAPCSAIQGPCSARRARSISSNCSMLDVSCEVYWRLMTSGNSVRFECIALSDCRETKCNPVR
jgi:hypothetical protein